MLPEGFALESVDLADPAQVGAVRDFLARFGLGFDAGMDMTVRVVAEDGSVAATGSSRGEVLRNIAVDRSRRGEGFTSAIVDFLMREQARRGIVHYLVYTKPDAAPIFSGLGFREIARSEPWAVLLESGIGSIETYLDGVERAAAGLPHGRAAVVVNCNPFTRGHRWLVENAARDNPGVIVFVVSEDRSLFPFKDRFDLVKRGLADLGNVVVVPTGVYQVSSATFPTYFTREEHLGVAQTHLDVSLFASRIAPRLDIVARYVGEEPYCATTESYNAAMREILPPAGIRHVVLPRLEAGGRIVSASTVRECIRKNDMAALRDLVPDVTWEYLSSPGRESLLERIRNSDSRH